MRTSSRLAALAMTATLLGGAAETEQAPQCADGPTIYVQNRGSRPVTFVVLRPDRSPCTSAVTVTFGNRVRVNACGPVALIGLNDGVEDTFTPVSVGHIYEIYPESGRWKVRAADAK